MKLKGGDEAPEFTLEEEWLNDDGQFPLIEIDS